VVSLVAAAIVVSAAPRGAGAIGAPRRSTSTGLRVTSVPVGRGPQSVIAGGGRVFVGNGAGRSVSVVERDRVVAELPVAGVPRALALDERTGRLHVANSTAGTTVVFDLMTGTTTTIATGPGSSALTPGADAYRMYVGSAVGVSVVDLLACAVTDVVPGNAAGSATTDDKQRVGYFSDPGSGTVAVLDLTTNRFTGHIRVGTAPAGLAVHEATGTVYVANSGIHHLSVVDGTSRQETATIRLRSAASSVAVRQGTHTIYTNGGPDGLLRIDGTSREVTGELPLGINPGDVAVDETTGAVLVTDPVGDRLHIVTGF